MSENYLIHRRPTPLVAEVLYDNCVSVKEKTGVFLIDSLFPVPGTLY